MLNINKSPLKPIFKTTKAMQSQSKDSTSLSQTNNALLPLIPELEPPSPDHNHPIATTPRADPNKWTQLEFNDFLIFWLEKFINYPYEIFSFHQPLRRNALFIELSTFLKARSRQQNTHTNKNSAKCKTKFQTIKRQTHRAIKSEKKSQDYDFIHYILEQSQKIASKNPNSIINALVDELNTKKEKKSELMTVTEKMLRLERYQSESLNESLLKYIEALKPKPKGRPNEQ